MEHSIVIRKLNDNLNTFKSLLSDTSENEYLFRPAENKWCLLEIVCHLCDEEQSDFRARVKHTLEKTEGDPPKIDPEGWVKSKKYIEWDYYKTLEKFIDERKKSVEWLYSLKDPAWKNEYIHPKFGGMSAEFFLSNWLAHDYLHFRQIIYTKYNYLKHSGSIDLIYAGEW
ncbi:MAG: DinB family protein [Ignavibacteriae bacterium]|nr:DinB family protein [Ignavibacteriota bacterium]